MEVQGLQEALKVEIQCHQKLAARSCPVAASKPPSLIKPPSQAAAISAVPTAHLNGQKILAGSEPQTGPANPRTGRRVALGGGAHPPGAGTAPDLPPTQMMGSLGSGPLKAPQVGSLHRLAGQAASVLPQVRPKSLMPDSLPRSPRQEPPQAPQLRGSSAPAGPTLPTPNGTLAPRRQPSDGAADPAGPDSGGPARHASGGAGAGVAYAIIAASPAHANGVAAVSEAVKVIIIQPQAPRDGEGGALRLPSQEPPPAPAGSPSRKIDEDAEKISFMVALGLVTNEHLEEIQLKRQERKRRSTANPAYSGLFEPERKRLPSHYLNGPLLASARDSEDFCWKDEAERDGQLRPCDDCPPAFHPDRLQPGPRYCPKCHKKVLNAESAPWPGDVAHETARREEKRRLLRRRGQLKEECAHLEEEDQQLNETLRRCLDRRDRLAARQRDTLAALERLKALIGLIRVTETDPASSAPPPPSWMKSGPSASPFWTSPDNESP